MADINLSAGLDIRQYSQQLKRLRPETLRELQNLQRQMRQTQPKVSSGSRIPALGRGNIGAGTAGQLGQRDAEITRNENKLAADRIKGLKKQTSRIAAIERFEKRAIARRQQSFSLSNSLLNSLSQEERKLSSKTTKEMQKSVKDIMASERKAAKDRIQKTKDLLSFNKAVEKAEKDVQREKLQSSKRTFNQIRNSERAAARLRTQGIKDSADRFRNTAFLLGNVLTNLTGSFAPLSAAFSTMTGAGVPGIAAVLGSAVVGDLARRFARGLQILVSSSMDAADELSLISPRLRLENVQLRAVKGVIGQEFSEVAAEVQRLKSEVLIEFADVIVATTRTIRGALENLSGGGTTDLAAGAGAGLLAGFNPFAMGGSMDFSQLLRTMTDDAETNKRIERATVNWVEEAKAGFKAFKTEIKTRKEREDAAKSFATERITLLGGIDENRKRVSDVLDIVEAIKEGVITRSEGAQIVARRRQKDDKDLSIGITGLAELGNQIQSSIRISKADRPPTSRELNKAAVDITAAENATKMEVSRAITVLDAIHKSITGLPFGLGTP